MEKIYFKGLYLHRAQRTKCVKKGVGNPQYFRSMSFISLTGRLILHNGLQKGDYAGRDAVYSDLLLGMRSRMQ